MGNGGSTTEMVSCLHEPMQCISFTNTFVEQFLSQIFRPFEWLLVALMKNFYSWNENWNRTFTSVIQQPSFLRSTIYFFWEIKLQIEFLLLLGILTQCIQKSKNGSTWFDVCVQRVCFQKNFGIGFECLQDRKKRMEKSKGLLGLATFQSRSAAKKDFDGFGDVVNVQFLGDHRAQWTDGRTFWNWSLYLTLCSRIGFYYLHLWWCGRP